MTFQLWIAFIFAASANILAPGPAIVLAIQNGLSLGMRKTFYSSLGNITAIGLVGLAVTLGLGAVITTEPKILSAMRVLGGSYLLWLAYQNWKKGMISLDHLTSENSVAAGHEKGSANTVGACAEADINTGSSPIPSVYQKIRSAPFLFRQSLLVGLTNPKMIVFLLALFPLFVNKSQAVTPQLLIMTITFMGLSFLSLTTFALAAVRFAQLIQRESIVALLNKLIALVFGGFGLTLIFVGFWG